MASILIVEDELHIANGLRFNLEAEGFEIEIAGDGKQALEVLLNGLKEFDAIVLDVMLPEINGFEVARRLRAAENFTPVLMLTARGRPEDVLRGFAAGADDYLPKPFDLTIFLARLHGLLRRREWLKKEKKPENGAFRINGKTIDFENLEIKTKNETVQMTLMEAKLLRYLIENAGTAVSRRAILETVVLICLGTSWMTAQFGLSLALGAFIAGMVISESEYSHQVTADILPFRDVFNSLFFVSIGMLLSLSAFIDNLGTVLLLVTLLVVGKALIVLAVVRLMGFSLRISVMTALGLAQIGEFSFILAKTARPVGLLPDADYQSFLAASIISMIATPFLIAAAPRIGYFIQSLNAVPDEDLDKTDTGVSKTIAELNNHVVIVGYGFNGRNLARVLRAVEIPYIVLEANAEMVRKGKAQNEKIVFGDATRHEVLHHVSIEKASIMVVAISDPAATRRTVGQARQFHKDLYIIVRTRYMSELDELHQLGADEVIAEEFETSIEIFSRVLHGYGASANLIEKQVDEIRSQGYRMLRSASASSVQLSNLNLSIDNAATETVELLPASPANGKTIGELDLRAATGATVLAAVRDGNTKVNPGANYKLEAGDSLVLLGTQKKIDRAVKLLMPPDLAAAVKNAEKDMEKAP
jgi:CPA2 family monovalent cation:H+ antiporter-2